ncbi:MAG TPA: glycosyltransferase [Blastocatellia bacterium]|nr:glycosyltransferase [Blastocatellia bacterium]HMV86614.1 glycosyltransferase [Blastocatellia bacterium]HMX28928.1 glycosyltransferase [Blastocatellia bacterium]HMY71350.1 glycosyltransferase [Blastocatellia bacterium]HMZ21894.1 glycosyltransferase [Blastocatellia bacterium]
MAEGKIKILHVIDSLDVGGMERVVIDVANGLDPARFEQSVCCLSRRGQMAHLLREGVRCIDLGKGAKADRLMPLKIARVIRREQPDIVHSQSWSGVDTTIAKLLTPGVRLVHSEHGRNFPHLHAEPWKHRIARRALYQLAEAVFAVSAEVREFYCRQTGFSTERMIIIPNGIDPRRIDEADGRGARAELGFAESDFVIGTVARLNATKDTITLARAFANLHQMQSASNLKLLIVGDGSERARLETFVTEQGLNREVIFAGLRHDVPRLLQAMDVFALPSLSEGMPLTVLEAMAARLPVVATRVGALPELVEEGSTGFLVAPKDADVLADRLARLHNNPILMKSFGAEAGRKVEREFSLDRMLRRYADLYHSVFQNKEKAN